MKKQTLIGFIVIIIGLFVVVEAFRFSINVLIAPFIFFFIGYFFHVRHHRFLSIVFFIISASILFDHLFSFSFIGLLIAAGLIYYGYRLLKDPDSKKERRSRLRKRRVDDEQENERRSSTDDYVTDTTSFVHESHVESTLSPYYVSSESMERIIVTPEMKRNYIGDVQYVHDQFELTDFIIWNGLGDVKIDFSKAIIPEGETVVVIQGLVGDINLFVPEDLAISIQANSWIGDLSLFKRKDSGFNPSMAVMTKGYKSAPRRVKLVLSTVLGEVKVRAV